MVTGVLPDPAPVDPDGGPLTDPQAVVEAFLHALAASDVEGAAALLADDVRYVNVGLPTVRGRARVAKVLGGLAKPSTSFEVYLHAISADGPVVLTERTDVLVFGSLRAQFWVCGRFDVRDGRIELWRDAFDFVDITRAFLRGLAGMVLPGVRPPAPSSADDPPGR
ncbi:MAG: nuclear transport factor 2 family protein [Actinobacteria bacterium]|nr:nuclear transport factor 2 family protein [Actinomycetota bacterium]